MPSPSWPPCRELFEPPHPIGLYTYLTNTAQKLSDLSNRCQLCYKTPRGCPTLVSTKNVLHVNTKSVKIVTFVSCLYLTAHTYQGYREQQVLVLSCTLQNFRIQPSHRNFTVPEMHLQPAKGSLYKRSSDLVHAIISKIQKCTYISLPIVLHQIKSTLA